MQLSTIKSQITSGLSEVKNRVQANWTNLSTTQKVATVATSVLLAAGAVAAAVFGHLGLAALAVSATISAAIIHSTTAGLSALGLVVPSIALLRSPKAETAKAAEQTPVETAPEAVIPEPVVVAEPVVEAPVIAPSRLVRARNASVAFVKAHPRKFLAAGAAIALIAGVRHTNFISNDMKCFGGFCVRTLTNLVSDLTPFIPGSNPKDAVSLNF